MNTTAQLIADMQTRGWTVTFPAFGQTRALVVRATKGDQEWQRGWTDESNFDDALKRLHEQTTEQHGNAEYGFDFGAVCPTN